MASENDAKRRLRDARLKLERVSNGKTSEDPEYRRANREVVEAEKAVRWWRR
jgi:hypothetical protein